MHMLLQSAHLLKEEYLDLGTALLLSLFTRLLLAGGPCCLAAFPGARSEMKAEVCSLGSVLRGQRFFPVASSLSLAPSMELLQQ